MLWLWKIYIRDEDQFKFIRLWLWKGGYHFTSNDELDIHPDWPECKQFVDSSYHYRNCSAFCNFETCDHLFYRLKKIFFFLVMNNEFYFENFLNKKKRSPFFLGLGNEWMNEKKTNDNGDGMFKDKHNPVIYAFHHPLFTICNIKHNEMTMKKKRQTK